jgi:hypothetical protein
MLIKASKVTDMLEDAPHLSGSGDYVLHSATIPLMGLNPAEVTCPTYRRLEQMYLSLLLPQVRRTLHVWDFDHV